MAGPSLQPETGTQAHQSALIRSAWAVQLASVTNPVNQWSSSPIMVIRRYIFLWRPSLVRTTYWQDAAEDSGHR